MALLERASADTSPAESPAESLVESRPETSGTWRRSLTVHALALAVVLLIIIPFIGTGAIVNADEGAALTQARILHETGRWGTPNPSPIADPKGAWFPIHLSSEIGGLWYPYTKHLAYPAVLIALLDHGGLGTVFAAQALATAVAAVLAALMMRRLARRLGRAPSLELWTLWGVGLGSPLFFDSYWVIAHSIAAAGATLAMLGLMKVLDNQRLGVPAIAIGVAVAAVVRSEGVLFGGSLSMVLGLCWLHRRTLTRFLAGGVAVATTGACYLGDAALERWAEQGSQTGAFTVKDSQSWLSGRVPALVSTFLRPQLNDSPMLTMVTLAIGLGVVITWVGFRRGLLGERPLQLLAAAVGMIAIARLGLRHTPIPGMIFAFPVAIAGMVSLTRRQLLDPVIGALLAVCGAFTLAVVGTQYSSGASGDWGGRYLHLIVATLVVVSVLTIDLAVAGQSPGLRRALIGSLVVVALSVTATGALFLHRAHRNMETAIHVIDATAHSDGAPGTRATVMSTVGPLGRYAWQHVLDDQYLTVVEPADWSRATVALAASGVRRMTIVTTPNDVSAVTRAVERSYRAVRTVGAGSAGWTVVQFAQR